MKIKSDKPVTACLRCGTCCEKGGPSFHIEDKHLIDKGNIPARFIYTIRKGEPAYDNIRRALLPVTSDVIKIKGRDNTWCCTFYDKQENACQIYANRPIECRTLKCWDTRAIEGIYEKNRLTRKDLLSEVDGLWDLVEAQQKRCSYETIGQLVSELKRTRSNAVAGQIIEMVEYDKQLRTLVVQNGRLDAEILEFLFGRPLGQTIRAFGLEIEIIDGKITLVSSAKKG